MKYVLLSADSNPSVYSVPDIVCDELERFCLEFCNDWLHKSPDAASYREGDVVTYDESDFIKYLNMLVFPQERSELIETLDWSVIGDAINGNGELHLPDKYKGCKWFNF